MPFKTKICGITSEADARAMAECGVEAVGLNFYERSKRYVEPSVAQQIVKQLPANVKRVGVFVNASSDAILETAAATELDYVQLHGDESPAFLNKLPDVAVIKAFRCKGGLGTVADFLAACDRKPDAILVDAYDPYEYGGTGKSLHWPDIASSSEWVGDLPLILAGGLTPENVATAIAQARPHGVDTASGVESVGPGQKDARLSTDFVANAAAAFSLLQAS